MAAILAACNSATETNKNIAPPIASIPTATPEPTPSPTPALPNLQAELLDDRNKTTTSPLGKFDFKNHTYPLPRGWQNPDGSDLTLVNGRLDPVFEGMGEEMSSEKKSEAKSKRRIGLSHVTTKFFDANGDGQDEAVVILKVETTGNAIPQLVYIYEWRDGKPELIWNFRTGDRADGGLKYIRAVDGELMVELFGQDRFILGETETGKITGDEEQLCCPTHFTRTTYKWNGRHFLMRGKRLTYSIADPTSPPLENYGDIVNKSGQNRPR